MLRKLQVRKGIYAGERECGQCEAQVEVVCLEAMRRAHQTGRGCPDRKLSVTREIVKIPRRRLVKEVSLEARDGPNPGRAQQNSISRENDVSFDERVVLTDGDEIGGWVPLWSALCNMGKDPSSCCFLGVKMKPILGCPSPGRK